MTTLVIKFPKLGHQTSTWVDDEWWSSLTPTQQENCMRRFVRNAYPTELMRSQHSNQRFAPKRSDYTWNEM